MKVLGISGKARHGKDFCARVAQDIADELGFNVGKFALADCLKARVYGELRDADLQDVFVNKPPAVREMLQRLGTEEGRDVFGQDFWVRQLDAMLYVFEENFSFLHAVVVADVRFPNECSFVKQKGIQLRIKSDRPTLTGEYAAHYSETALDATPDSEFDGIIHNNLDTTVADLRAQIRPYVEKLFGF